jgi:hypothetical protein
MQVCEEIKIVAVAEAVLYLLVSSCSQCHCGKKIIKNIVSIVHILVNKYEGIE